MFKIKTFLKAIPLMIFFIYAGCKDEITDPAPGEPAGHIFSNLPADTANQNKIAYFRFSDSTIVTGVDTATANWDIAFKSTTIFTNNGSSGPGQGGAVILTGSNFSDITIAPDTGYRIDAPGAPAIPTGSGNGWYNYDFATNVISPLPGIVLVIRTGNGRYAKVQILSYYKDAPQNPTGTEPARYYTFRYFYQPDGSRNFE